MRTINLQTVYQLVITALLLGACLGLLGQRLPWIIDSSIAAMEQTRQPRSALAAKTEVAAAPQNQYVSTGKTMNATVQVEVEVHSQGNANALARAYGPGDTEVKADTEGEGDGRSVAYITSPEIPAGTQSAQELPPVTVTAPNGNSSSLPVLTPNAVPAITRVIATVAETAVNLRSTPDLGGGVVGMASQGQQFVVVGRDPAHVWWLVCCDQGQPHWVHSTVVQVSGDIAGVKVITPPDLINASTIQAPVPTPTIAPPLPTVTPPAQDEFMLTEQAQFEERITPRIFLYVHAGDEGLGGYTLRVRKDDSNLPVTQTSIAGLPGYTWPIPTERQRYTNLKVEFPHVNPAGLWEVQLLDATGRAVGPIATFRLQPNEPNQEMYISYRKR